jgi:hypothetical protein
MKKIYKYPTGATIPEGAIYLCTLKNGWQETQGGILRKAEDLQYIWHYFLVEVKEVN